MSVLLWRESRDQGSLDLLTSCCQQQNLEVKEHDQLPDNLAVGPLLKSEPAILMIPAIKRDCLGVKLAVVVLGVVDASWTVTDLDAELLIFSLL